MIKNYNSSKIDETMYSLYGGDIKLKFKESGHRYSINDVDVIGVTTILKTIIAKGALINWAVKTCADYMLLNFDPNKKYTKEDFEAMVIEAKRQHNKIRKDTAKVGLDVHKYLENYIKAKINKTELPELPTENKIAINSFIEWEKKNKVEWLESEKIVYSKRYNYAGTMDFLAVVKGIKVVGDIKTSNAIYPESYYLQVAAYRYAYEEEAKHNGKEADIKGMLIIRVPKTEDDKIEDRPVNDYENNARAFIYGIGLYNQITKLKNFNKKKIKS